MRQTRRNRGFILLLVVAMIPLVGMVIAVMATHSKTLAFETDRAELQVHADNACDSGIAWTRQNRPAVRALSSGQAVDLILKEGSRPMTCVITRNDRGEVVITGLAADGRFTARKSRQLEPSEI